MAKNRQEQASESSSSQATAAVAPAFDPELEKLRLQNENLKLQLEIEAKRNPPSPDAIIEKQLERMRAEQQKALDELAAGPFKFKVHLPGNYPTTQSRHDPGLTVGASQPGRAGAMEAAQRYNAYMGILAVNPSVKHQIQELGGAAVELEESVPQIEFTPASDAAPSGDQPPTGGVVDLTQSAATS